MTEPTQFRPYEAETNDQDWKREYRIVSSETETGTVELQTASEAPADQLEEAWRTAAPESAEDARELASMSEQELDAELTEGIGTVNRWIQEHAAQAEFSNELFPDLVDIDEARHVIDGDAE
ncbi:hypothetical protein ACFFK0_29345 [Paenibacillus chartarius]|uniref:Uncharacterized protein n=1 Tax=Paenibacillus chartarius TaxID=747481 RepID=A0ABV6DV24_9BACL